MTKLESLQAAEKKLLLQTYERNPYLFTGGKVGFGGYKEAWKFEISRVSGAATASVEGKTPIKYQCAKVQPKL